MPVSEVEREERGCGEREQRCSRQTHESQLPEGRGWGWLGTLCNLALSVCSINIRWSASKRTGHLALVFRSITPERCFASCFASSYDIVLS